MSFEIDLHQTTDAHIWAKEFMRIIVDKNIEIDEGLMISWFANSIMTMYDTRNSEILSKMNEMLLVQKDNITDEYMKGMYNGMAFIKSIVDGKDPVYIDNIQ